MEDREKDNIDWIWDRCIDINSSYDPQENFKKLTNLLKERKRFRTRKRLIYLSISVSAVLLLVFAMVSDLFTNKPAPDREFTSQELITDKNNFIIRIGERTFVNMFMNSRMSVEKNNIIFWEGKRKETISTSGKELIQINVPAGKRYSVTLGDGSNIWLASNSSITFPSIFSERGRTIKATGHIFFEIEKAVMPFKVDLKENLSVIVYGTIFNVKYYSDLHKMGICLNEGKVSLKIGDNENVLMPNQSLQYDISNKIISTKEIDSGENIFWKNGSFYFNDVLLENLAKELSGWFNVSVCFHTERIKTLKFSGNIPDNLGLEEIIDVLNAARTFRCEYINGVIHLYNY
ncbi:MAG: DUF4974 domain-containing protein [Bacteroidales bacterium]|nr:FecR family protein [Bacteroidales bacterium]MDD2425250.1 DUF4974 domain-containing protein [Bacteroidales bacterium]MDD3988939.1 DUF4974 domain-containing protein [Bacteroidales bacterium]MDD4638220.1 DUF4974 domain-containing protein [Bacteroidales bacterium]